MRDKSHFLEMSNLKNKMEGEDEELPTAYSLNFSILTYCVGPSFYKSFSEQLSKIIFHETFVLSILFFCQELHQKICN